MVLLRDFADHRHHRRLMTPLFKPGALRDYLAKLNSIVGESMQEWNGSVDIYRVQKRLALDVALCVFGGFAPGPANDTLYRDLSTVLDNVLAVPGPRRWRGLRARNRLRYRLHEELAVRRRRDSEDLFTRLAQQTDELGRRLSDQDVVDHMLGLIFAAHDTTASALTTICLKLAEDPAWQTRLRAECQRVLDESGHMSLDWAHVDRLVLVDAFFRETLRQYSPVQIIPRRSIREFHFEGQRVPANTPILLFPQATHFDPEHFPEPDRFDPLRFVDSARREPFAFIPFGRGSHMCLGMHFAAMEVKAVLYRLLLTHEIRLGRGNDVELNYVPVVRPLAPARVQMRPP